MFAFNEHSGIISRDRSHGRIHGDMETGVGSISWALI